MVAAMHPVHVSGNHTDRNPRLKADSIELSSGITEFHLQIIEDQHLCDNEAAGKGRRRYCKVSFGLVAGTHHVAQALDMEVPSDGSWRLMV